MNLSFAGCGFLGIYHVGVAGCFKKYAPHLLLDKISGASFGAIAACCLLCDLPLGELTSNVLRVASEVRLRTLGPFSPSFNIHNILLDLLERSLPDDAHLKVNGKLHISLTRVYDGHNVVVSQFSSKQDLMQALMASSFIPVFSGLLPPKFHGVRYMDGGFSDNLPMLDENTITVSPFCGESDICPRDPSSQLFHINYSNTSIELSRHNIYRFARILFPPKPEVLSNICKQGFDDALRFLHRNNLINCTRCLAVQSTFVVSETIEESFEYDPQCKECQLHRQEAMVANLPETIASIFQEAIESANKGLLSWLFRHRGMKLLSLLTLPYTLPVDIVYATFTNMVGNSVDTRSYKMYTVGGTRLRQLVACPCVEHHHFRHLARSHPYSNRFLATSPKLSDGLWLASQYLLQNLAEALSTVNRRRQQMSAHISCQLAITEYGDGDSHLLPEDPRPVKNKMNFNFTLNIDERAPTKNSPHQPSTTVCRPEPPVDDDTFDNILEVTTHHDAVMAYYYMDEDNQVKVTEIFDVTEAESDAVFTAEERDNNTQLEFSEGWDEPLSGSAWLTEQEYDDEQDFMDQDNHSFLSDPESEWRGSEVKELPESERGDVTIDM